MLVRNTVSALLLLALAGRRADGRAVVREDVKGTTQLLRDEARDDPFFDHNPQYGFAYRIHDEETGDAKDQSEERRGDAVHGSYSVVDPDGTLRVVRYTADDAHGFNAVVSLTPGHAKPFTPKPVLQRRVAVVQNTVDVPVPVQHHVLPSTSQQILGDRRVLVEHPKHQASALVQQHLIQPPLSFGLHQDVHHLIPHGPAYQLHHIHQLSPSGVGTHHQMTVPIVQIENQGELDAQQQHVAFLHVREEQLKQQQAQIQAMLQAQQQDALQLMHQQEQQQVDHQSHQDQPLAEQQTSQQQQTQEEDNNVVQQDSIVQEVQGGSHQHDSVSQQQDSVSQQQDSVGQQQDSVSQQQDSVIQQQDAVSQQDVASQQQADDVQQDTNTQQQEQPSSGFSLPQVIDVRHAVVSQSAEPQVSQVRSLDGGLMHPAGPYQRTTAVHRTSAGLRAGSNFITFSSPYAQYTIS